MNEAEPVPEPAAADGDSLPAPGEDACLSERDRTLLLLGALTEQNRIDDAADRMRSALEAGDLTEEQLHEIAIFLCHYVGWPRGTSLDMRVGSVAARVRKAARRAAEAEAKRAAEAEPVQN
ncbi:MAG TPA: hypothetical protein VK083_21615 [Nocardia sp.]|uniref:hypothetical protein n=1 Tax=Nocardia TaxID=1817 RepID=UPI002455CB2F|nr:MULTISPECIES: hypothetical protein [Nocardia]HLS79387.1 hypothetical protein [Nocardia sp.]